MLQPKYKIYPSLLDSFQRVLNAREEFESFFNEDPETGGYKKSYEEVVAELEQNLLDSINRVPHEPIEAADKGTAFNEIVDCLIHNRKPTRDDVVLKSVMEQDMNGHKRLEYITAEINGFTFPFNGELCTKAAEYFAGSISQYLCKAPIDTKYGVVELYGYLDELRADVVYDIKTTKQYTFGKFENHWQKDVYPYCLIKSGMVTEIREFEYTIFELKGGTSRTPEISGNMYRERYDFDIETSTLRLQGILEQFIEWLEAHRDLITDKRIFNNNGTNSKSN